jgi:hypothetical protein
MILPLMVASVPLVMSALLLLPAFLLAEDTKPAKAEPRRDRLGSELPAGALARMGGTRFQDDGLMLFTHDGAALMVASSWSVGFWDVATGKELRRVTGSLGGMGRQLVLAPDGKTLACGGGYPDYVILLIDVATGKELGRISQGREVSAAAFADGGKLLLTAPAPHYIEGQDSWVRAHEVSTRKEVWKIVGLGFAILQDGKTLGVVKPRRMPAAHNVLQFHDVVTGAEKNRSPSKGQAGVRTWPPRPTANCWRLPISENFR